MAEWDSSGFELNLRIFSWAFIPFGAARLLWSYRSPNLPDSSFTDDPEFSIRKGVYDFLDPPPHGVVAVTGADQLFPCP